MSKLSAQSCVPCKGGEPPLPEMVIQTRLAEVTDWELEVVKDVPRLRRRFRFKDFKEALAFTNSIGELAESEGHHPRIVTEWGSVTVEWWTHKIAGLHNNDFIMAAKSDAIYRQ